MKDLHKYRDMPQVLHSSPQFFTTYPKLMTGAAKTLFTVDGVDKKTKEREVFGSFRTARRWRGLVGDAVKAAARLPLSPPLARLTHPPPSLAESP